MMVYEEEMKRHLRDMVTSITVYQNWMEVTATSTGLHCQNYWWSLPSLLVFRSKSTGLHIRVYWSSCRSLLVFVSETTPSDVPFTTI